MCGELSSPMVAGLPENLRWGVSAAAARAECSERCTAEAKTWPRKRSAGFTLTEVIIASTLLIVAMVPILRALTSAIASGTIIERRTQSLVLAQRKLDEIRARSIYNYDQDFTQSSLSLGGSYLCDVADSIQTSDLRRLSVSVGYDFNGNNSLEGGEIDVTLTTLLARRW